MYFLHTLGLIMITFSFYWWKKLSLNSWIFINKFRQHISVIAQLAKNLPAMRPPFNSWDGKFLWRRDRLPTPVFLGFPCGSTGKESACNVGNLGSVLGLGRSPGERKDYPLQYSGLENSMDCIVHGVAMTERLSLQYHSRG